MSIRNENGFTLVEVLLAMVIFSIGILAVINMQLVASWTNTKSRYMTQGIVVAQGKIEELMGADYDAANLVSRTGDVDFQTNDAIAFDASLDEVGADADWNDTTDPFYTLYWNIRENYPYPDTKTVRVIVRWDEKTLAKRFDLDMVKSAGD